MLNLLYIDKMKGTGDVIASFSDRGRPRYDRDRNVSDFGGDISWVSNTKTLCQVEIERHITCWHKKRLNKEIIVSVRQMSSGKMCAEVNEHFAPPNKSDRVFGAFLLDNPATSACQGSNKQKKIDTGQGRLQDGLSIVGHFKDTRLFARILWTSIFCFSPSSNVLRNRIDCLRENE